MMTPREAELTAQVEALTRENELLRQKLDLLIRRIFGSSSEKLSPDQLELALTLATQPAPVETPAPAPRPAAPAPREPRRPRIPENLPVVEEVLEPEAVVAAPEQWRRIGEEVSEQLDYEPGRFLRRRLVRPRYVRKADAEAAPVIAPLPARLQERCLATPALLAQVIVSKYCDHLPLYRQEQIFATRFGVEIPRQTLSRWMGLCAGELEPVAKGIRTGVLGGGYVQLDETPIEYLDPGRGRTAEGYLWTCARPGGDVFFHWETTRSAECIPRALGADFTGVVQCDGYRAYDSFARTHARPVRLAACWAHVRRKFHEALKQSRRAAAHFLGQIQALYQVEAQLRASGAGPTLRQAERAARSRMIVARLRRMLEHLKPRHLPQSALGLAISYALSEWEGLTVYLEDGRVEIDNNTVENAIRPTAVGKKNWLFVGDGEAGDRGAILYTVVESCRRRGIDPYEYLKDILTRLPVTLERDRSTLLPENWAKARAGRPTAPTSGA